MILSISPLFWNFKVIQISNIIKYYENIIKYLKNSKFTVYFLLIC
jgi:hypothetical protein